MAFNDLFPHITCMHFYWDGNVLLSNRILAIRKAEKDEEKRAMERIRQKLEEDKVDIVLATLLIL